MKAGQLDQIVKLESSIKSNVSGEIVTSWVDEGDVFAKIITEKGSEVFESARTNARSVIRVLIRYRDDVDVTWRILWEGQSYNIIAPPDRSSRRDGELWITCESVGSI